MCVYDLTCDATYNKGQILGDSWLTYQTIIVLLIFFTDLKPRSIPERTVWIHNLVNGIPADILLFSCDFIAEQFDSKLKSAEDP